ncbi:hypothetical protein P153DRAFT_39899 [Dothidotthia symphoricarpi CBS 119687]|uniref:Uncharacterized protein n=1 Tax=Dothidotthia symphoricarpi CBS 119687 TaxID=1392245 RepID=A0A6A6A9Q8_9PLEO|nr:uncharacterized protein P153DRAFT_39899 [Dothidotthia symphoricarpi CBS 119687]KAF2128550.1 hypothetical protein P153DRAFT_39899 [Dothidotthia symphoricarpi CBS 119687]
MRRTVPYTSLHPQSWTEPARRWRKSSLQAIMRHTVQFQRRAVFHRRKHGGASILLETQSQQYLSPDEEKAMVKFLLLMSHFGHPVQIKYIPSLVRRCKGP